MRRISSLSLLAVVALLAFASCGKAAEKVAEKAIEQSAGGGDVDIDEDGSFSFENDEGSFSVDDEGNIDIESEDGDFSIDSSSGELPDDFPDVPLPGGFEPQSSSQQSDGEQTIYTALGMVDGDPEDIFDDAIDDYESDGYETEGKYQNSSGGDFSGGAQFVGDEHSVSFTVFGGGDDGTTVSVTVTPTTE